MLRYYIWTVGCQMNEANSERIERSLRSGGSRPRAAGAGRRRDPQYLQRSPGGRRQSLRQIGSCALKLARPDLIVAFGGCMSRPTQSRTGKKLPYVDVFFPPSEPAELLDLVDQRMATAGIAGSSATSRRKAVSRRRSMIRGRLIDTRRPFPVARWLPIMTGCNRRCTYCIVPFRRGREISRPIPELVAEAQRLAALEGAAS